MGWARSSCSAIASVTDDTPGRCDGPNLQTMRYSLLAVFGATGLIACYLRVETSKRSRGLVLAVMCGWALVAAVGHGRLLDDYVRHTPINKRRVLADYLVSRKIRFGSADFWDSYTTVFFSGEKVIKGSNSVVFIKEYEWLIEAHPTETAQVTTVPCVGGTNVVRDLYVCPPVSGTVALP